MTALKAIFSRLRPGEDAKGLLAAQASRGGLPERRKSDRRRAALPWQDREARLSFAAQAVGFGTCHFDFVSGDSYWSPELKAIAGLPPGWLPGGMEALEALVHPEDRPRFAARAKDSLDPGGPGQFEDEVRLQRPDGSVRWVQVRGRSFFAGEDAGRRPLGAQGVVVDVTASRQAELALRRSQQDLELAIHGAALGVWNWNLRTGEMLWSDRCYQLVGLPAGEPVDYERFLATVFPEDRDKVNQAARRALESAQESSVEYRCIFPDGSIHWNVAVGRVYHDEATGEALRMTGIAIDVTERKALEETLRRTNEELENRIAERTAELVRSNEALERSNLELQQFAFIAAHDLQTPLRSISGFAQLMQREYQGRLDAQADVWLNRLIQSAQRMHELIRDLLAYSQVESRGNAFRPTDFRQIFDDVVATQEGPIRAAGALVTRGDLPVVEGDRNQLAQVLHNLIDNALKYRGPAPPRVHVAARREGGEWLFSVRDNGIGIADKHQDRIFDIFRRLHTQQEYPGTGIGLAICRRVIHRHGGRIWVKSAPGQGSTFHFTLPVRNTG